MNMDCIDYFNNVIEKMNARKRKAHPYGEDTTQDDIVDLLASIANSLAVIADHITEED